MDDLISRAALKAVVVKVNTRGGSERFYAVIGYIFDAIAKAPTVDAEIVRHGRWMDYQTNDDGNVDCHCSVCMAGETHSPTVNVPYCWKCGAKMDSQEGESNDGRAD